MTPVISSKATTLAGLAEEYGGRIPSTVDLIVRILRDAIVRGLLTEGTPIRQDHVAAELGISKIPLREALSKLEGQGLVTMLPRRGAVVAAISAAKVEDIYQIRLALEPQVLASAIPQLSRDHFGEAEKLIDEMDHCSTEDIGGINWLIHRALYVASGREVALQILDNLHVHVERCVRLHIGLIDHSRMSNGEHRGILAACRDHDIALAQQLLRQHLDGIRQVMVAHFDAKEPAAGAEHAR